MLEHHYNNLSKLGSLRPVMRGGVLGGTLGSMYGLGDEDHNYHNELLHKSTGLRGAQGFLSGASGIGGYKFGRGLGYGRVGSGLLGLLSAAGAAAILNPKLPEENPYKLPF